MTFSKQLVQYSACFIYSERCKLRKDPTENSLLLTTSCLTSVCWQLLSTIMNWLQHHRPNESQNRGLWSSLLKAGPISKLDQVALPSAQALSIRGSTALLQQYLAQFTLSSRVHSQVLFGDAMSLLHMLAPEVA